MRPLTASGRCTFRFPSHLRWKMRRFPPSKWSSTRPGRCLGDMATSVVMPALEMAQETGKIISWLKKEGEAINKGEPLLEIETDKAVVEVEATADGILAGVKSQEGDVVPVGVTIAWIVAPGEKPPAEGPTSTPSARKITESAPRAKGSDPSSPAAARGLTPLPQTGAQISPKARRLAKEQGIDLSTVKGTGPEGTIISDDILAAAPAASSTLSAVARLMAERTTQSWTQVPHFFLVRDLDAGALIELREKVGPKNVTHTDLLVAITAKVLTKHPKVN